MEWLGVVVRKVLGCAAAGILWASAGSAEATPFREACVCFEVIVLEQSFEVSGLRGRVGVDDPPVGVLPGDHFAVRLPRGPTVGVGVDFPRALPERPGAHVLGVTSHRADRPLAPADEPVA